MAFSIANIKAELEHGGARASLFEVQMVQPAALNLDANAQRKFTFMCSSASLPESSMSSIDVPYFGRKIKVAGARTFADWDVTIINDEDFLIREFFERWSGAMNAHGRNIRTDGATASPESYKAEAIIRQYGKAGDVIRQVQMCGMFPTTISEIDLNWNSENEIENFTVNFAYDYWTVDSSTVTIGGISSVKGHIKESSI